MQQLKGFFGLMFREDSVEDREVSRVFKVTNYIRFNRTMTMGTRSSGLCNKLIPPYNVRVRSAEPAKERRRVELRNLRYTAMVKSFLNEHKKNLTPEERVASELRCKNIVIYDDDDFPIHGRTKE